MWRCIGTGTVQAFDDAVGRRLGLGPADLRCLDWLADGPKLAGSSRYRNGTHPGRDYRPRGPVGA